MRDLREYSEELKSGRYEERIQEVYVDKSLVTQKTERFLRALVKFEALFGRKPVEVFSAPGRSEVSGNHTDHQKGHVLAASINLDAIAVVAPTEDMVVHLVSDGYPLLEVELDQTEVRDEERETTAALVRGVAAGFRERGFSVGGFEAYVTSDVLIGAGLSSSAAFESLIGTIFSGIYNELGVSNVEIAKIGQYAENVYFGKPCGLMDQMACSVGGLVYIDFKDVQNPVIEQIPADFETHAYSLCIVDTKGSHANLTADYAAIPAEMKAVAAYFGKECLREVPEEKFIENLASLREQTNDRAVLRGMHFYGEQKRVSSAVNALKRDDFGEFLRKIRESGDSSSKLLQNSYSPANPLVQNITVALALSEYLLKDQGVCRIHGGGFAGTIQAFVKNSAVAEYKEAMEKVFGADSCHVLKVRPFGGIRMFEE